MLQRFKLATETYSRNKNYQFWQYGNHAEEIFSEHFLETKLDYIHMNPVRAGIVSIIDEYIYSNANNFVNGSGVVEVELIEIPKVDTLKPSSFDK